MRVGVYFFGTAKNREEALEEAEFTVNLIKDYNLSYPVVYDIESFDEGRLSRVSYSTITDNILTFTETVGSYKTVPLGIVPNLFGISVVGPVLIVVVRTVFTVSSTLLK